MVTRDDEPATVTFTATKLEPPMIDWSVGDVHMELMVFNTLLKCG